jgi:hypothetical protein
MGLNVLLADSDMVFLQNPLPELRARASDGMDLQIQDDAESGRNSGFMYLSATAASMELLQRSLHIGNASSGIRQQRALNLALREMNTAITVHVRCTFSLLRCLNNYYELKKRFAGVGS